MENVPRVPSGKDRVWISKGVIAVVASSRKDFWPTALLTLLACGRGGSGGGCSSTGESLSCPIVARSSVASQGGRNLRGTHLARPRRLRNLVAIETALPSIMPFALWSRRQERRADRIEQWRKLETRSKSKSSGALPGPLWPVRTPPPGPVALRQLVPIKHL